MFQAGIELSSVRFFSFGFKISPLANSCRFYSNQNSAFGNINMKRYIKMSTNIMHFCFADSLKIIPT